MKHARNSATLHHNKKPAQPFIRTGLNELNDMENDLMKRNRIIMLLAVCMSLLIAFGLTACGNKCEHTYNGPCDSVCNECGEAREIQVEHTYSGDCDATCNQCKEAREVMQEHTYYSDCDEICNECEEAREITIEHNYYGDCDSSCHSCGKEREVTVEHSWKPATCTTPEACEGCGAVKGAPLGHTWKNADCITPKTCTACSITEGEALGHTWINADCYTPKTCKTCATTEGEPLGHTPFEDDGDCTTEVRCSVCDEVTTAANESHTAEEDDYDCTTRVFCVNCEVVLVEAKEHVFDNIWNATDAHHWYECANDGCDANSSYGEHYGEDDGDCTTWVECEMCGWILIGGNESHTPAEDDGDCTTPVTCTNCDTNVIEANETHSGGVATCLKGKLCEVCEIEYTPKDLTNHQEGSSSYTDNGDGTYTKIHECGEVLEEKHTFDSVCDCGEKIIITKMTIFGEDIVFDPSINAYTVASSQDKVDMKLVFHGINLKYLSKENALQKLQIDVGVVANFFLNELSLDYDENTDTLIFNEQLSSGRDFIFNYSNDGGATWEDGCKISIKRLVGISVNESKNGQVTTNENAIAGECVTVNISADDGYKFKSLIVKDSLGNEVPVENNQFTMPLSDVTISAIFVCENECTFVYEPNEDILTHKKVCSLCDYVEIESEAHTTNEYSYVDNGDTHERIWKCCGGSITQEHDFSTGNDCVCGADAICFTELLFVANEEYLYDEETLTYTVIIPPDKNQANLAVQLVGRNLEYLTTDNEFLKVKEIHHDFGESEYDLYYLIGECGFVLEWIGLSDGEWVEYYFSNDGGESWTKYRVEIKQSY